MHADSGVITKEYINGDYGIYNIGFNTFEDNSLGASNHVILIGLESGFI